MALASRNGELARRFDNSVSQQHHLRGELDNGVDNIVGRDIVGVLEMVWDVEPVLFGDGLILDQKCGAGVRVGWCRGVVI
jgi:hypothetical protein